MSLIWLFHFRPVEMATPRYFDLLVVCSEWFLRWYCVFHRLPKCITSHLSGWKNMSICSQHASLSRSFCSSSWSDALVTSLWLAVSSAKSRVVDFRSFGRSFMNSRNNEGPRADPWRTPDSTGTNEEVAPSTAADCLLCSGSF